MSYKRARLLYCFLAVILCVGLGVAGGVITELKEELAVMEHNKVLLRGYIDQQSKAYDELVATREIDAEVIDFWYQAYQDEHTRCAELRANPIIKEVPVGVIKEVEKIVEVEKEVTVKPTDWVSLIELENFLDDDDTDSHIFLKADANGIIKFSGTCEEYAFQLRDRAFDAGKRLETEDLTPAEYKRWYGKTIDKNSLHCICKAIIGNEVWYIEPADDRHWIGAYLD